MCTCRTCRCKRTFVQLYALNLEADLRTVLSINIQQEILVADLILQVIPPVRPSLFNASLLLNDGAVDNCAQNTEGHGHTMVIVAMNASALPEVLYGFAIDFEAIGEFFGLNSEFGYSHN